MSYRDLVVPQSRWENQGSVTSCHISRNTGATCAVGTSEGVLHLWRLNSRGSGRPSCLATVNASPSAKVTACTFDADESHAILGASTGGLRLLDVATETITETFFSAHRTAVSCIACHPVDSHTAVTGSLDATVKCWDLRSSQPLHVLRGQQGGISSLAIPPDGRWVACGDDTGKISVIDTRRWKPMHTFQCDSEVTCLRLHPLELLLAAGTSAGTVQLFDVGTPPAPAGSAKHSLINPVWSVDLLPAGASDHLLSTSSEGLRVHRGTLLLASYDLQWCGEVADSAFSEQDAKVMYAVARKSELTVWEVALPALEAEVAGGGGGGGGQQQQQQQRAPAPGPMAPPKKSSFTKVAPSVQVQQGQAGVPASAGIPQHGGLVGNPAVASAPLIGAESRLPLDLDFAQWRQGGGGGGGGDAAEQLRKAQRTGEKMQKLLASRVEAVKVVRGLWAGGDRVAAIRHAEKAGQVDVGVVTDLLGAIVSVQRNKESLAQEHCNALIPGIQLVLSRGADGSRPVGLACLRFLCNKFLFALHRTVTHPAPSGVDLAHQERTARAKESLDLFVGLKPCLRDLASSSTCCEQVSSDALAVLKEIDAVA